MGKGKAPAWEGWPPAHAQPCQDLDLHPVNTPGDPLPWEDGRGFNTESSRYQLGCRAESWAMRISTGPCGLPGSHLFPQLQRQQQQSPG